MKKTRTNWILSSTLAVGLVLGGPHSSVWAAAPAGSASGAMRNVTVNFVNTEMVDVLKALATQTGSNIVAGPEVKGAVSISMKSVQLDDALEMVTRLNNLAYQEVNGTYVVTTAARLKEMYPSAAATEVYQLTNMKPETAVKALAKVAPSILAQEQGTAMVVLSGNREDVRTARIMLAQMEGAGTGTSTERETIIRELKYLNAMDATRTLATMAPDVLVAIAPSRSLPGTGKFGATASGLVDVTLPGGGDMSQSGSPTPGSETKDTKITLTPGDEPKTIVLSGYRSALDNASRLLDQLDVAPRQVEITARIVDLSDDDALKLGLRYTPGKLDVMEAGNEEGVAASSIGRVLSFGQFARIPFNMGIDPELTQTLRTSRILASPRVAAVDGRPARIFIGDTITYVISQNFDRQTGVVTFSTEKTSVGISLLTVPKISQDGSITLEVHPTVSSLVGLEQVGNIALPRIQERSVDTTVMLRDGETIAIGGLFREDEIKTMTQVPYLSRIPILGELFKHRNKQKVKSDITVFITTRIVDSAPAVAAAPETNTKA